MIAQGNLSIPVYEKIKDMIMTGSLKPGQKIKQEHLAKELGVSRTPLHRAFQMLENEFLVESIPRRGYFVRKFEINEIFDAFECREAIEGVAARRVAENASSQQIEYLYSLFSPFANNLEDADLKKYEHADFNFHKSILEFSGNKILKKMEMFGNVLIKTYQRGLIRGPKETFDEHIAIIDAIANHDGESAEKLLRKHFRKSQIQIINRKES